MNDSCRTITIVEVMRNIEITNWRTMSDLRKPLPPGENENPDFNTLINLTLDRTLSN